MLESVPPKPNKRETHAWISGDLARQAGETCVPPQSYGGRPDLQAWWNWGWLSLFRDIALGFVESPNRRPGG